MIEVFSIASGAVLGALSRFYITNFITAILPPFFPFGTLFVNLTGCFLIGFAFALFEETIVKPEYRLFLTTGFLGSYTTFSTFGLESMQMIRSGEYMEVIVNIIASNLIGLFFVFTGMFVARFLLHT